MNNKLVYQLKISGIFLFVLFASAIISGSCNDNQRKEGNVVNDTTPTGHTNPRDSIKKVTKWALLKVDAEKYKVGREYLVIFADEKDAKIQLEKYKYNVWVQYSLPRNLNKTDRERYELFCYGYLSYHDQNVKTDTGGHTIYFEWNKEHEGNYFVRIYITPPYKEFTGDPPRVKQPPPPPMGIDF